MTRWSQALIPTLKEVPAEAQVVSHVTMLRAGYMRKVAAGIYSFLPLGWRVVKKVEDIIREEMNRAGALEILMPAAVPAELWQESGRWQKYGPELLRFKDRKQADFLIGPTHEEVVVDIVRRDVKSYRQLPVNLYQIQTKFRDEARPRAGLMRGREFIMKDAYSFDVDDAAAQKTYRAMYDAYARIFKRCGLAFRAVEADTGNIGGTLSHEFQVLAHSGEDKLVSCTRCDYAANVEQAEVRRAAQVESGGGEAREIATPGQKTIDEVAAFLGTEPRRLWKTLVYKTPAGDTVLAVVRGDHEVNEIKLRKRLGVDDVFLATELAGSTAGFYGPVGRKERVLADLDLRGMRDAYAGGNKPDVHLGGLSAERDLAHAEWVDLRTASAGDPCPRCGDGVLERFDGIEVGHVFFLGTRYSAPMACSFLGDDGQLRPMVMGCYGIGVTRVAAAAIEQNHDADGIVWPMSLAPYQVEVLTLQAKDADVVAAAEKLYAELTAQGIEVLFDDRDERPGAKFKDADLVGIPLRVAVGKKSLAEGKLEVKHRREKQAQLVPAADAAAHVAGRVRAELEALRP
jgi:prolyl-tRNA synthetase